MGNMPQPRKLTNGQALLLQLFERELTEEDLTAVRQVLVKHLAKKAEAEAERILKEKRIDAKTIEKETNGINENRTQYFNKLRSETA